MDSFREIVNCCGFHNLGYCGPDYTWSNMQEGESRICLRLDRALATLEWLARFERMKVYHLVDSTLDHCALLVTDSRARHQPRVRHFHFEAHWVKREDCKNIIEASWGFGVDLSTPEGIAKNLRICAADLSRWNLAVYGQIPKKIHDKRNRLNALAMHEKDEDLSLEINRLRGELNDLLDDEEMYWGQKEKAHWLKEGDKNTKFFHAQASERRKQNTIVGIWDEQGRWCDDEESIAQAAISYFDNIYSSSHPSRIAEVTEAIPSMVTDEMNESLIREFTGDEVVVALKQIHPNKASGLDGMSAVFLQKHWSIVGNNITNMILNVLNHNIPISELNKTNISLIPKISNPKRMTDFRPISLCNVVYKLISKILANRLKPLLPQIISENQSAVTSDRLITDNVSVAFELMHYLDHKTVGKEGFLAVKLDMSKAFDRVEWGFISKVMERLGFCNRWRDLVMQCITSISYSVLINGVAHGNVHPSRGLRQGDPLSPSLFLLCTKGLSALIHQIAKNKLITGISIARGCPKVTHLFFADDSILFCKASLEECHLLRSTLMEYEEASR